jgi:hypothetical protein
MALERSEEVIEAVVAVPKIWRGKLPRKWERSFLNAITPAWHAIARLNASTECSLRSSFANTLHSQESDRLVHHFTLSHYKQWVFVNSSSNCLTTLLLCYLHNQAPISECHYQHVVTTHQFECHVPCEICSESF